MGEFTQDDQKDDKGRDPAPLFVVMDDLVAKERDQKGGCCDDDDAGITGDIGIDGVDQLSADNDIY